VGHRSGKGKQKKRGESHHCSASFFSVYRSRYAVPPHSHFFVQI